MLLAQALLQKPDLLILDEPFEGLDQQSVQDWMAMLNELKKECVIVLIVNRLADIPAEATHLAMLENLELVLEGERQSIEQQSIYQQLVYAEQSVDEALPDSITITKNCLETNRTLSLKMSRFSMVIK